MTALRTKRRYAHELYPHPAEDEIRPLEVEVPYLYARAVGLDVQGTGWSGLFDTKDYGTINDRTMLKIAAWERAFLADALLQGLAGQAAWQWAEEHCNPDTGSEWIWERAVHYGVDPDAIKPYPCGPEPDHHDHYSEPDARGWRTVTRAEGRESDCPDCCCEPTKETP